MELFWQDAQEMFLIFAFPLIMWVSVFQIAAALLVAMGHLILKPKYIK